MTDITLKPIKSGYNLQKINDNFETIEENINNTSIQSTGGNNVMSQELDMNSQRLTNLPAPLLDTEAMRKGDFALDATGATVQYVDDTVALSVSTGFESAKSRTVIPFDTLSAATVSTDTLKMFAGAVLNVSERESGLGSGGFWDVVLTSSVTPNTWDIVVCTGIPTLSVVLRVSERTNLRDLGADSTGVVDAKAILLHLISLNSVVRLGEGSYLISDVVDVPSGKTIIGEGAENTTLTFDSSGTFFEGGVRSDGQDNITLKDFEMTYSGATTSSVGILVKGTCRRPIIERVTVSGFGANIWFSGYLGATPGIVTDLICRDCIVENALQSYGIVFEDTSRGVLDNILSRVNGTDGIKVRKNNNHLTIIGGVSHDNGQRVGTNGNGIDTYAGGFQLTVTDIELYNNDGAGIYIKTGDLNDGDRANYGDVANISLNNIISHNNATDGWQISRNSGSANTDPLVSNVQINGGRFYANTNNGGLLRGRNIQINGGSYYNNQQLGMTIAQSIDVSISGVINYANCLDGSSLYGMQIASSVRVTVDGGSICGVDNFNIQQESDYALETKRHNWSINVHMTDSDEIRISDTVQMSYNVQPIDILGSGIAAVGTSFILNQKGTLSPEGVHFGGIGSTYLRKNSTVSTSQLWFKTALDTVGAGGGNTGWKYYNFT